MIAFVLFAFHFHGVTGILQKTKSLSAWLLYKQHIMGRSTIFKCSNMEMCKDLKEKLCMIFWCITSIVSVTRLCGYTLHGKPYFLFPEVLKRWSFQKNCAGIWSFLYYREKWYFFFPKIWSYPLSGKWKMIFLKKTHENVIFSSGVLKRWPFQKDRAGT